MITLLIFCESPSNRSSFQGSQWVTGSVTAQVTISVVFNSALPGFSSTFTVVSMLAKEKKTKASVDETPETVTPAGMERVWNGFSFFFLSSECTSLFFPLPTCQSHLPVEAEERKQKRTETKKNGRQYKTRGSTGSFRFLGGRRLVVQAAGELGHHVATLAEGRLVSRRLAVGAAVGAEDARLGRGSRSRRWHP